MPSTIAILYPQGRFDLKYYESQHMAMLKKEWTRFGFKGYRIVKIARTPDPTATAPFQTLVLLEFESGEGFDEAMTAPSSAGVLGDMPNFTDQTPTLLVGSEVTTWTA